MSDIVVTLPDGSELSVAPGSTVEDVAYEIGPGLGEDTVGGIVDGDLAEARSDLVGHVSDRRPRFHGEFGAVRQCDDDVAHAYDKPMGSHKSFETVTSVTESHAESRL